MVRLHEPGAAQGCNEEICRLLGEAGGELGELLCFWFGDAFFDDPSRLDEYGYIRSCAKRWYMGGAEVDMASFRLAWLS